MQKRQGPRDQPIVAPARGRDRVLGEGLLSIKIGSCVHEARQGSSAAAGPMGSRSCCAGTVGVSWSSPGRGSPCPLCFAVKVACLILKSLLVFLRGVVLPVARGPSAVAEQ